MPWGPRRDWASDLGHEWPWSHSCPFWLGSVHWAIGHKVTTVPSTHLKLQMMHPGSEMSKARDPSKLHSQVAQITMSLNTISQASLLQLTSTTVWESFGPYEAGKDRLFIDEWIWNVGTQLKTDSYWTTLLLREGPRKGQWRKILLIGRVWGKAMNSVKKRNSWGKNRCGLLGSGEWFHWFHCSGVWKE